MASGSGESPSHHLVICQHTHIVGCVIRDDFADRGHLVWSPHETWCFGFVHDLPVSIAKISVSDIGVI